MIENERDSTLAHSASAVLSINTLPGKAVCNIFLCFCHNILLSIESELYQLSVFLQLMEYSLHIIVVDLDISYKINVTFPAAS